MHITNQIVKIFVVALFSIPISAYADSWSCSSENNVREINIEYPTSAPLPCHVVYKKLTEGFEDPQILWTAHHDDTYCEDKAKGLVETLEESGWVCTETIKATIQ